MSGTILLAGPRLSFDRGIELLQTIAPLVLGRALALTLVESSEEADSNYHTKCGRRLFRDGDVALHASLLNGDGNPRDGWGYHLTIELRSTDARGERVRASLHGSSYDPSFDDPLRVRVEGASPETRALIADALRLRFPEHRDTTFTDPWTVRETLDDLSRHGHEAWVRDFLSQPLLPTTPGVSAHLCARKLALFGPDAVTARTAVTLDAFSSVGWRALADAGGDELTSAADARVLAALTNPFDVTLVEAAHLPHLTAAIAHVIRDPRWRWLEGAARDAYEARAERFEPAPSLRVVWTRPEATTFGRLDVEVLTALGVPRPERIDQGFTAFGPPLAPPGSLSHACGIGTGHSVRRAMIDLASPAEESLVAAACHTNCEDRLTSFGIAWLGRQRQIVWRSSYAEASGQPTRTPIEIDVIDHGDGRWAHETVASLSRFEKTLAGVRDR